MKLTEQYTEIVGVTHLEGEEQCHDVLPRVVQLEEIKAAAQIIFNISDKASFKADAIECPHGNIPAYPAHAWWCDKCWYRLRDALKAGGRG